MGVRAGRSRRRVVSPAAAVVAGLLTAVMLTSAAVISSMAHQPVLAGFGQGALFLVIGLIGLIVAWHQARNPMGWVLFGVAFFVAVRVIAGHRISIDSSGTLAALDNPAGSNAWWAVTSAIFFVAVAVCWVAWLGGQVQTFVRSSGERRLQLKWLLSGATIFILAEIALFADDIDRIISRTLAYALVTGALVGVYAGLVLLATRVFSFSSPVSVAFSTLVAAALFNPLRRRMQRAVDRKFNRARYDADQTLAAFSARLQDTVDLGAVRADLMSAVPGVLEPTYVSVSIVERAKP